MEVHWDHSTNACATYNGLMKVEMVVSSELVPKENRTDASLLIVSYIKLNIYSTLKLTPL
jgi:hypothetical protein